MQEIHKQQFEISNIRLFLLCFLILPFLFSSCMTGLIWLFDWSWVLLVFCLGGSNLFCFIFLSFSVYLVATLITLQNKLNEEIKIEIDFFFKLFHRNDFDWSWTCYREKHRKIVREKCNLRSKNKQKLLTRKCWKIRKSLKQFTAKKRLRKLNKKL